MPQKSTWEEEYKDPQLITKGKGPRKDLQRYLKFLRKTENVNIENLNILDLGSGVGSNANYLAEMGSRVVGMEISKTAIRLAKSRAEELNIDVEYLEADIGSLYQCEGDSFDLAIDVMSSNSLNEKERSIYLSEVHRVLKTGGHFFVRTLCKDGDRNAKNLLKQSPGLEHDTYINKDMNLVERVFSQEDFTHIYSKFFKIQELLKKTNYAHFKGQNYKRNYWIAYMKKI